MFERKIILVTGGTGSFGNFLVSRLLENKVKEVRVLSRDEKKQHDMRTFYGKRNDLSFIIGDIRHLQTVDEVMDGVDIVFQAAAIKQVPTCEYYPMEAVRTNIVGVENVVRGAINHRVDVVVSISTDKAVKPVNVMGMTKAIQERIVLGGNGLNINKGTKLMCVRYGNVLRSRGSAVPFFRRQLMHGRKITITDDQMTRFFLTLNDAIDLVFHAVRSGEGGDIFVRKAPSARILDLARCIAEGMGKKFEYHIIGKYPGEKVHEILISEEELQRTEDQGVNYRINPWWSNKRFNNLNEEYSSQDHLVDIEILRTLINKSDSEFKELEISDGEFARF